MGPNAASLFYILCFNKAIGQQSKRIAQGHIMFGRHCNGF